MKLQSQAVLHGIKSSKGEIEGRGYDSTTFHISVDLGATSNGESIGVVTRPFKCGTSEEFKKWAHLKNNWPATGIPVLVAAGRHDLWSADAHRQFARRLGARVAIYPAGHSPGETTPYELARDLVAFFDEITSR